MLAGIQRSEPYSCRHRPHVGPQHWRRLSLGQTAIHNDFDIVAPMGVSCLAWLGGSSERIARGAEQDCLAPMRNEYILHLRELRSTLHR
ncbi:MAG: hypothetical protein JWO15_1819 [Sphingomonadales bacterium]|nr:hypothetical protein [Sphingomonadales bacterium]